MMLVLYVKVKLCNHECSIHSCIPCTNSFDIVIINPIVALSLSYNDVTTTTIILVSEAIICHKHAKTL